MTQRRPWIKALSFRLLDRPALQAAAAIHYTSEAEAREAFRLRLTARAAVIPLGIDLAPFRDPPPAEVFLNLFPAAHHKQVILFLSRIDPKKGVELLLQSFSQLHRAHPDFLVAVAGDGDATYLAKLKTLADDLGIGDKVLWTGFLSGNLKASAFAASEIFALPSFSENFGIALLEAMAAGKACVSTTGVALALESDGSVLVSESNVPDFTDALSRLMSSPGLRLRMAQGAHSVALAKYSLEAMGASLHKLYSEISANPSYSS